MISKVSPMSKKILIIAQSTGHGSRVFKAEAEKARSVWSELNHVVEVVHVPKARQWRMHHKVLSILRAREGGLYDAVVFLCHGTWKRLRCGFTIWNTGVLAKALADCTTSTPNIILYACSCGRSRGEWPWKLIDKERMAGAVRGADGFAMRLADDLLLENVEANIFAHSAWGHATKNPYAYWVRGLANEKKVTRLPIVRRANNREEWKRWYRDMRSENHNIRYEAPLRCL